jgi:hypothetical protein
LRGIPDLAANDGAQTTAVKHGHVRCTIAAVNRIRTTVVRAVDGMC